MFQRLEEDDEQQQRWMKSYWSKLDRRFMFIAASVTTSVIFVILIVVFTVQGSTPTNQLKVISTLSCGRRPGTFQRPWLAEVYFRKDTKWKRPVVMGIILSPRYILIPAHEYSYNSQFGVRILFGEIIHPHTVEDSYFANRTYRDVISEESEVHENFRFGVRRFNLALLRLDTDVEFNDRIQPICLPNVRPQPPERLTILPDVANSNSTVTKVDFGSCSREWRGYGFHDSPEFSESHACVKLEREQKDCYGIEGSPLLGSFVDHDVERFVQYGFKYFGDCTDGLQIYTNVSYHLEWILERIKV